MPVKIPNLLFAILATLLAAFPATAAEVNIEWQKPEEYRDIRAGQEGSQQRFQQRVIDELGRHIQAAADDQLPEGYVMNMTVTDIDLAGDVEYFFSRFPEGVRVVRDLYFPSIEFTYELLNERGEVVESGEENVKDIGMSYAGRQRISEAPLGYEKRMIDRWFAREFGEYDESGGDD